MRKLLLMAVAVAAFASCSQEETFKNLEAAATTEVKGQTEAQQRSYTQVTAVLDTDGNPLLAGNKYAIRLINGPNKFWKTNYNYVVESRRSPNRRRLVIKTDRNTAPENGAWFVFEPKTGEAVINTNTPVLTKTKHGSSWFYWDTASLVTWTWYTTQNRYRDYVSMHVAPGHTNAYELRVRDGRGVLPLDQSPLLIYRYDNVLGSGIPLLIQERNKYASPNLGKGYMYYTFVNLGRNTAS